MKRFLVWLAMMLAVALVTRTAVASDADEAMAHYQRGIELFQKESAYDAALVEFERAYKLAPTYKLLYNIGQVNRQLNDYAKAMDAFDRYLREGGNEIATDRKIEVRAEIVKLSGRVARLEVRSNGTGEVSVDDVSVGTYPLAAPIIVNIGKRRVTMQDTTYGPQTRLIDVVAGETLKVEFNFVSAPLPKPAVVEKPSFPLIPWVITGGLAVATGIVGVVALGKSSSASSLEKTAPVPVGVVDPTPKLNEQIDAERKSAKTLGLVTDLLLAGTVVSAGVSTYLTLRFASRKDPISLRVTPGGAVLSGSF
jgi:hypothetical protein